MSYLLERNNKGHYELDGRETILKVEENEVIIEAYDGTPLSASFVIGETHYYLENDISESHIHEISQLTYDEEGEEIIARTLLNKLEIPLGHPLIKYIFVSGVSLHNEPYNEKAPGV